MTKEPPKRGKRGKKPHKKASGKSSNVLPFKNKKIDPPSPASPQGLNADAGPHPVAVAPVPPPIGGPLKRRGHPPPHVPTDDKRNLVSLYLSIGYSYEQTARQLKFSVETLVKYYQAELADGGDRVTASIAANMARIAQSFTHPRAVVAGIFWLKCRAKWNDGRGIERPTTSDEEPSFSITIGSVKAS